VQSSESLVYKFCSLQKFCYHQKVSS
jgi:hypothetical protein